MKILITVSIFLLMKQNFLEVFAQKQQYTTPVPILKQINRHNEDGSYSYGYEGADGSFKIETKQANGDVQGKYGYIDDAGNMREIEYGANKNGFQPTGTGIDVPPPTIGNSQNSYPALGPDEVDDGQYREDPKIYEDPRYNSKPSRAQAQFRPAAPVQQQQYRPVAPVQQQQQYRPAQVQQQQQPQYRAPVQQYRPTPIEEPSRSSFFDSRFSAPAQEPSYQQPRQQQYYQQPQQPSNNYYQNPSDVNLFAGHPASNLDLNTGSYSVNYSG
ncbi:unnamed protein product [Diamesa tonsa]